MEKQLNKIHKVGNYISIKTCRGTRTEICQLVSKFELDPFVSDYIAYVKMRSGNLGMVETLGGVKDPIEYAEGWSDIDDKQMNRLCKKYKCTNPNQ